MMDDHRFFKVLWRINAVLLVPVFLAALVMPLLSEWRSSSRKVVCRSNFATFTVNAEGETVTTGEWRYGDPVAVPGGSGFIVPLYSTWSADEPGRTWRSCRNLLFVGGDLKATRWLLPDNERGVLHWEFLAREHEGKAMGVSFMMEEPQADAEKAIAETPKLSLHLARPDLTASAPVLTGLTRCIGKEVTDDDHLVVFYVKDGAGHAAKIALADLSLAEQITLKPQE